MAPRKKATAAKKKAPAKEKVSRHPPEAAPAQELPQEEGDVYLTMDGSQRKRYVNAFAKKGQVIEKGETVCVGPIMASRMLRDTQLNVRGDRMENVFRYATEDEILELQESLNIGDAENADMSLLGAAAVEEALGRGDANPQTEEAAQVTRSIQENRIPVGRRRRA